MYLSCDFNVLKIFGFGDGTEDMSNEAGDVLYAAYLGMAKQGLGSVEMWDPKSQKWGQAHSQARFSILKCFLDAGDDFCKLDYTKDDLSDLTIKLDRSKILTTGRKGKPFDYAPLNSNANDADKNSCGRVLAKDSHLQEHCRCQGRY